LTSSGTTVGYTALEFNQILATSNNGQTEETHPGAGESVRYPNVGVIDGYSIDAIATTLRYLDSNDGLAGIADPDGGENVKYSVKNTDNANINGGNSSGAAPWMETLR